MLCCDCRARVTTCQWWPPAPAALATTLWCSSPPATSRWVQQTYPARVNVVWGLRMEEFYFWLISPGHDIQWFFLSLTRAIDLSLSPLYRKAVELTGARWPPPASWAWTPRGAWWRARGSPSSPGPASTWGSGGPGLAPRWTLRSG